MFQRRQYHMDLLRILACFMVVMLHVSARKWGAVPVTSGAWKAFNFYNTAVRSSVPLFFMISGMLFLSKEKLSVKQLFEKHILKLLFVYFLWSCLYAVDSLGLYTVLHDFDLGQFAAAVLGSKYHLWYLPALISVYLILPILHAIKDAEGGKLLQGIVGGFFLFTIVQRSLELVPILQNISAVLGKFDYAFASYCGYFVLGHVICKRKKECRIKTAVLLIALLAVVSLTAVGNDMISAAKGTASSDLYSNYFISTFVEACIIFIVFLRMKTDAISDGMGQWIQKLSKYTFLVYLLHPFVLEHVDSLFGLNPLSMNAWLSVPLIACMVFGVCLVAACVLEKVPYINKIV